MASLPPIERYFALLEILAASRNGQNQTSLSKLTGLPKPAVHRLMSSLSQTDLVQADAETGKVFSLGRRMHQLAQLCLSDDWVQTAAHAVLNPLARQFNETCFMARLEKDKVRSVAMSAPERGYRMHIEPGFVIAPHAGASAKAILAYADENLVRDIVSERPEALTSKTHQSLEAVLTDLRQVQERGFAVCDQEIDESTAAYACPVHTLDGSIAFSVAITGPRDRLLRQPVEDYIEALRAAGERFAEILTTNSLKAGGAGL